MQDLHEARLVLQTVDQQAVDANELRIGHDHLHDLLELHFNLAFASIRAAISVSSDLTSACIRELSRVPTGWLSVLAHLHSLLVSLHLLGMLLDHLSDLLRV